jgi:hypothetical protein
MGTAYWLGKFCVGMCDGGILGLWPINRVQWRVLPGEQQSITEVAGSSIRACGITDFCKQ